MSVKPSILLKVPYYSQRDNVNQPERTCNSSVHAMLLRYFKPDAVKSDDDYWNRFVAPYGDSTDHAVHTEALAKHGIVSEWRQDLDFKHIDRMLAAKMPMAIGVAHRGTVYNPVGGHIILVIGAVYGSATTRNDDVFVCNDPWGKGFDYTSPIGGLVEYPVVPSLKNRWLVDGANSGWGRIIRSVNGVPCGVEL